MTVTPDKLKRFVRSFRREDGNAPNDGTVDYERLAEESNNFERRRVPSWQPPATPKGGWIEKYRDDVIAEWINPQSRLKVIVSCNIENDGRAWIHFSISHPKRVPTWGELTTTKDAFLGDREAYQVLPPRARWVNIHPNVLNLYALYEFEGEPQVALPDFTRGTGAI